MKTITMKPSISDGKSFKSIPLELENITEILSFERVFSIKVSNKIGPYKEILFTLELINSELSIDKFGREEFFQNVTIWSKIPAGHFVVVSEEGGVSLYSPENYNSLFIPS